MRIKEGILLYNETRTEDEPEMTQKLLGSIVLPNKSRGTSFAYINKLANNKTDGIRISVLKDISKVLKVDFNYLLR